MVRVVMTKRAYAWIERATRQAKHRDSRKGALP